jgi:predicted AlkP superfamily phosphohydrolase/phosphomutase
MAKHGVSRRTFLAGSAAAGAAATLPFSIGTAKAQTKGRVVMLGFDGVEPSIAREMIDRGELPNLAKVQNMGSFKELGSTSPPQSPVAWTSFATCKNPGGHNIYDFIRRDPKGPRGPMPYVGTGKVDSVELTGECTVKEEPKAVTYRKGDPFWSVADQQGLRCKILNVPFAFPADPLKNGKMLCGLGVTDLRGTTSTYTCFSDSFTAAELKERVAGGNRVALQFDGENAALVKVEGPRDQRHGIREPQAYTTADVRFTVDRKLGVGQATVGGKTVDLAVGEWSEWFEVPFSMCSSYEVYSVARFYPITIGEKVKIYMSCQQFHPGRPYVPFTEPNEFAKELQERYGLFKTIGWAYDTHALRQGDMHEDAFLQDVVYTMAWREKLTLDELEGNDWDMLISVWTATDRVGHMFWRYRDPKHPLYNPEEAKKYEKALEDCYKQMDRIVGNVMAKLKDDDLLMVLSDHGFESWRTGFNLNNWLEERGYLTVNNRQYAQVGFLQGIDWANTQAYCIGLSSLYINQQGRESFGSVAAGDSDNLIAKIKDELLQVKDPSTGEPIFTNVYTRAEYSGEALEEAPDFSLGYNRYYQSSKASAKGAIADTGLLEPNDNKWSGEHAAADMAWCPGILFSNKTVESNTPNIRELGITALKYLGKDVPSDYEGEPLV